jgi:hypothetical protein
LVVNIPHDAYNFRPTVRGSDSNALAQRVSGRVPIFVGKIFRDQRNWHFVVDVRPSQIAASDKRDT